MRRKAWIALAAVPVLLIAGDTIYWHVAARQLETGFDTWRQEQQAAGWTVSGAAPRIGGWPFRATLTIDRIALSGGGADVPGGLHWNADRLQLGFSLFRPLLLEMTASGNQRVRIGGGPEIAFTAEQATARLTLRPDAPPNQVTFAAANLRAEPAGTDPAQPSVTIAQIDGQSALPAGTEGESVPFSLQASSITLSPAIRAPLGSQIQSVAIKGTLNGPLPADGTSLAERATAWRDSGGSLEIQRFGIHWGSLNMSATATLALDPQLQPMGTGTARLVGYAGTLDTLAGKGVLSRSAAIAAKAVLSLLAQPTDDDQTSEVEVPLTLQYRTLSMRQVPLVRLPELDWPAP